MRSIVSLVFLLACPIGMCLIPMLLERRKRRLTESREEVAVEAARLKD